MRDGVINEQVIKMNTVRDKCWEILKPFSSKDMKRFNVINS